MKLHLLFGISASLFFLSCSLSSMSNAIPPEKDSGQEEPDNPPETDNTPEDEILDSSWWPAEENLVEYPDPAGFPAVSSFPNESNTGVNPETILLQVDFPIIVSNEVFYKTWNPDFLKVNRTTHPELFENNHIVITADENDFPLLIFQNLRLTRGINAINDSMKIIVRNCEINTKSGAAEAGFRGPNSEEDCIITDPEFYTIENCTVKNDITYRGSDNTMAEYTEEAMTRGVIISHGTVRNCNISGVFDAVYFGKNVIVKNNYIHDLYFYDPNWEPELWTPETWNTKGTDLDGNPIYDTTHSDGLQNHIGDNNLVYNNYVDAKGQNAAFIISIMYQDYKNLIIKNNYFKDGTYCVFLRGNSDGEFFYKNVIFENNIFYNEDSQRLIDTSFISQNDDVKFRGNLHHIPAAGTGTEAGNGEDQFLAILD